MLNGRSVDLRFIVLLDILDVGQPSPKDRHLIIQDVTVNHDMLLQLLQSHFQAKRT